MYVVYISSQQRKNYIWEFWVILTHCHTNKWILPETTSLLREHTYSKTHVECWLKPIVCHIAINYLSDFIIYSMSKIGWNLISVRSLKLLNSIMFQDMLNYNCQLLFEWCLRIFSKPSDLYFIIKLSCILALYTKYLQSNARQLFAHLSRRAN